MPFLPSRLFGIIGHPLGHSLSPLLHNWGFGHFGLPGVYMAWPVAAGRVADFMTAVRVLGIEGVSVTIPHKAAVMAFVDEVTDRARAVGAVNTLFWRGGRLCGENTDVAGFVAPLRGMGDLPGTALVVGGGGAARAAVAGLKELGLTEILMTNRTAAKAETLARDFGVGCVAWETRAERAGGLVVNATPLGMLGKNEGLSPMPTGSVGAGAVAYDLVYNPHETVFLRDAAAAGARTVTGLEMFFGQAVEQFRLWTGLELPRQEGMALLRAALYGEGDGA
ncbi:shikimate dehydrogenase [Desulfolutivibrio sp.]|uniref:shikimate dehydrogenase n=1 Tax=Desulfolutivibrio sp. TaxID=2773296 RepID=UPI002F9689A1